jgi:transporter family-2 protein
MNVLLIVVAIAAGAILPIQAGSISKLGQHAGGVFNAVLINFCVGALTMLAICAPRLSTLPAAKLGGAPWWAWIGGVLGATYVSVSIYLWPRLGAVVLLGGAVVGQMIGSAIIDHWGLLGAQARPMSLARVAGVALLLTGVFVCGWAETGGRPAGMDGGVRPAGQ